MKPFNALSLLNVLKRAPTILEWLDRHRWVHVGLMLFCGTIIAAGVIAPWYEVAARMSGSWPHHNFFLIQKGQSVGRGSLVAFIMQQDYAERVQPGRLHRDYADVGKRWMKRIVGVPGDHILVQDNEVYINGQSVGRGIGIDRYGQRIDLATLPETIPEGQYYVALPHPRSFDSRYYGLIRQADILGTVTPLI
ncbi:MAG TPA: signal peptidase I [Nitrospira sp.]|jgi:conjugative transfer signal peptidase TraF|nr:signal peptidase I [Nitrospira sp.]HNE31732.1 signal peptidase I [Nitrospira sp.]